MNTHPTSKVLTRNKNWPSIPIYQIYIAILLRVWLMGREARKSTRIIKKISKESQYKEIYERKGLGCKDASGARGMKLRVVAGQQEGELVCVEVSPRLA